MWALQRLQPANLRPAHHAFQHQPSQLRTLTHLWQNLPRHPHTQASFTSPYRGFERHDSVQNGPDLGRSTYSVVVSTQRL